MINRIINSEHLALILSNSRQDAGKTQKYMASSLGKSVTTIQNWEAGIGAPNLIDTLVWFDTLGLNPLRYILDFLYPDVYETLSTKDEDQKIEDALIYYIKEIAPMSDKRKLAYNIFGDTGSSWSSQLNMLTAHNHSTMRSRVNSAWNIYTSYMMEKQLGQLILPNNIMPDDINLYNAIVSGQNAVVNSVSGYTNNLNIDENILFADSKKENFN